MPTKERMKTEIKKAMMIENRETWTSGIKEVGVKMLLWVMETM